MVTMVQSKSNAISFMFKCLIRSIIWVTKFFVLREREEADNDGDEDVENIPDCELNVLLLLLLLLLLEDVNDDDEDENDSLGKFRMGTIGNDI